MAVEIVDLGIKNGGHHRFSIVYYVYVYQRVIWETIVIK